MNLRTPADCLEAIKRLNPLQAEASQRALQEILTTLIEGSPPPNQHLEVLEAARELLAEVQAEVAKSYALHPLPPGSHEDGVLSRVTQLWRLMARSYAHVTRRDAAAGTLDDQRALLCQRRVFYHGMVVLEYMRAHRMVPGQAWLELHESFSMAEAQGVARVRAADTLNAVWHAQSPVEAFIAVLLVDLGNPYGRASREFGWICRWAQRFAPYCNLLGEGESQAGSKPTAYGLDLGTDHGLRPIGTLLEGAALRRFDGAKLADQIQAVLNQFKQGMKPAALGLGEDCPTEASARLLVSLYRPWGLGSAGRRFPRRAARGELELTGDWLAIGFHIAGKRFEQPGETPLPRSLHSDISLLTFGEKVDAVEPIDAETQKRKLAEKLGFVCERLQLQDQSVGGFRVRSRPNGELLEFHQLVGVRPPDSNLFMLGQISWLMFREDASLEAGINLLNGKPWVIAVRQTSLKPGGRGAYQQAFQLPEVPALKKPETLVLPGGWHQPQRVIEILENGATRQVRLTQALVRGANFDQVSFELLNAHASDARRGSSR